MSEREERGGTEWTAAERAALDALRAESPPADLEESVVAALAGEGLLVGGAGAESPQREDARRVPARRAWGWGALAVAACLAAFLAGVAISDRGAGRSPEVLPAAPERWMLLLYEDESYRAPATDEEHAARVAEYAAWARGLGERGISVEGEELAPESGAPVPAEPRGVLSGYFIVEAADRAAAVAIARSNPHLAHGGTVVVRRIVQHGPPSTP